MDKYIHVDVHWMRIYLTQIDNRSYLGILRSPQFFLKKFIYLIRDWGYPYEYSYGKDGGNRYIKKQLEVNFINHESMN